MRGKYASLWFLGRCINASVVTAGSSGAYKTMEAMGGNDVAPW